MRFPGEEHRAAKIQHALQADFDFADRFLSFWTNAMIQGDWDRRNNLDRRVRILSKGLGSQSIRLFRSVTDECRRAEGNSAGILARTLYESAMALRFVLQPEFRIVVETNRKGVPVAKLPSPAKCGLEVSQLTRALLYLFYPIFQNVSLWNNLPNLPGLERVADSNLPQDRAAIAMASADPNLSEEWISILSKGKGYVGLSIKDLAELLGEPFDWWYRTWYSVQCRSTHAGEGAVHCQIDDDGTTSVALFSDESEVTINLHAAQIMVVLCAIDLQKAINFGAQVKSQLALFVDEIPRLLAGVNAPAPPKL